MGSSHHTERGRLVQTNCMMHGLPGQDKFLWLTTKVCTCCRSDLPQAFNLLPVIALNWKKRDGYGVALKWSKREASIEFQKGDSHPQQHFVFFGTI